MYDLPIREKEIAIKVPGIDGVVIWAEPLRDEQWLDLSRRAQVTVTPASEGEEQSVRWALDLTGGGDLFVDRLRRIEGLSIGGQPFDRANSEHVETIRQRRAPWISITIMHLYMYGQGLSETDRGNSERPGTPSTTEPTFSPASANDSGASC